MTEQQRKGIEILNNLKAGKHEDGTPMLSDDDYFFLMSFIIDKPQEVYVPQVIPQVVPQWPLPGTTQPMWGPDHFQRWEITCKAE